MSYDWTTISTFTEPGITRKAAVNVRDVNAQGVPGAQGDYQSVADGVMAAGSAVLTSASGLFSRADVGKTIWLSPTDRTTYPASPRTVTDGAIAAGTNTLTSASAVFGAGDVGKWVSIAGAGLGGGIVPLVAQITGYTNPTTVALATNAVTTVGARAVADAIVALYPNQVTSATAAYTAADVGRTITIAGAGQLGSLYTGVITVATSGTVAQLSAPIGTSVSAATLNVLGASVTIFSLATGSNVANRDNTVPSADGAGAAAPTPNPNALGYTITSANAAFTQNDIGRIITISGAGSAGATLTNQIVAVNGTVATLALAILTTVTTATITLYGVRSTSADGGITTGLVTLTSATASFVAADIGSFVSIPGAGLSGAPLLTQIVGVTNGTTAVVATPSAATVSAAILTISPPPGLLGTVSSYQNANQVTLSQAASVACAGAAIGWGTDDTAAIQACYNAVISGGEVFFPPGTYLISRQAQTTVYGSSQYCLRYTANNTSIRGYGATLLLAGGHQFSMSGMFLGDNVNPLVNVTVAGLTFDGNAMAGKTSVATLGQNAYVIPSQIGCAPLYGADDFQAPLNIRGPYTGAAGYPKVGQLFTTGVKLRDLNFFRTTNGALEAVCYVDDLTVTFCRFDGQGVWSTICHVDGVQGGYIANNLLKDCIPGTGAAGAMIFAFNGDTGYRPTRNCTIVGNVVRNTLLSVPNVVGGGRNGIGGCFQGCVIAHNTVEGMPLYGIFLGTYANATSGFYAGSLHNVVQGNRLLNNRYGIMVDGAPGTTKAGTVTMGSGAATLSLWTGTAFTQADVGCWISIAGASNAPQGGVLMTQITLVTDATHCTVATANQSGGTLTATAVTVGAQNGQNCNQNLVADNHVSNDGTTKTAGDFAGAAYFPRVWTSGTVGLHIAGNSQAPVGGNQFVGNRIEGNATPIWDRSIGTGMTGYFGNPTVYNSYDNNDCGADSQFVNTRIIIDNPLVRFTSRQQGGWVFGQSGGGTGVSVLGAAIKMHHSVVASWTPTAIAAAGNQTTTVAVTGAAVGDTVIVAYGVSLTAGLLLSAQVTSANTVTVTVYNATAGSLTPAATTALRVDWWQH